MVFLMKLKPLFFSLGLLLEALGGAGLIYSFKVHKILSFETSILQADINMVIVGAVTLLAGIFLHCIFILTQKYTQKLEEDLFESRYSYSTKPVEKRHNLQSPPSQYASAQNANHGSSQKQPFTRNTQSQYYSQQQQRFQRSYQQVAKQTSSHQNQTAQQRAPSTTTVKPAPARTKGVYNAYYVPKPSPAPKEKDFDKLLDGNNEFFTSNKGLIPKIVIGVILIVLIFLGIRAIVSLAGTKENIPHTGAAAPANGYTANAEKRTAAPTPVSEKIVLTSEPSGAAVVSIRSNRRIGTTPFTIKNPPQNKTISLRVQKAGFASKDIKLTYTGGVLKKHAVLTMVGQ